MSLVHSGILSEMLSKPLVFGEVVHRANWANTPGTKEVIMGPPSPPRYSSHPISNTSSLPSLLPNDDAQASSSTPNITTPPTTPNGTISSSIPHFDRKGKSPTKPLYPATIDLTWPSNLCTLKRPAVGLFNPSMACYANATLQILLHTPPVLRIAQDHTESECELYFQSHSTTSLIMSMR